MGLVSVNVFSFHVWPSVFNFADDLNQKVPL